MAEPTKRKRSGARTALNTIDKRPPREFICLIGGPSNFFNGFQVSARLKVTVRPDDTSRWLDIPQAAPTNHVEVQRYMREVPRVPSNLPPVTPWQEGEDKAKWAAKWRDALTPALWAEHGWSPEGLDALQEFAVTPADIDIVGAPSTHDLFWGNFALPASRLHGGGANVRRGEGEVAPSLPAPQQGDIVTFIVWQPSYDKRDKKDFEASPYNIANWDPADGAPFLGAPPSLPTRQQGTSAPRKPGKPPPNYTSLGLSDKADELAKAAKEGGCEITPDKAKQFLLFEGETIDDLPDGVQLRIFDTALKRILRGETSAFAGPVAQRLQAHREADARRIEREKNPPKLAKLSEAQINRRIMASAVGPNEVGLEPRRNKGGSCTTFLHDLSDVGVASDTLHYRDGGVVPDVMVKVLFARRARDIEGYVRTGTWLGSEIVHYELAPEDEVLRPPPLAQWMASLPKADRETLATDPPPMQQRAYDNQLEANRENFIVRPRDRGQSPGYWKPIHWDKRPSVDRTKVKITRFDYFGHAKRTAIMLEYGWSNAKGELPRADVRLETTDLEGWFSGERPTTQDAVAVLWGCNLGAPKRPGTTKYVVGPWLASKGRFHEVIAADTTTLFHDILTHRAMPVPSPGGAWLRFWSG